MLESLMSEIIAGVHVLPSKRSSPLDNPQFNFNDEDSADLLFGGESYRAETGDSVTHNKAMSIAAVWQAINLISGDIAKIPLSLYTESASGVRREVKRHPLIDLVQMRPNRDENAFKFWRRVMVHALLWNNAYIYAPYNRANGAIPELFHFLPDRTIMKDIGGDLWCVTEVGGKLNYISADEVVHIEGVSWDCIEGADLVLSARNSFGLALAQEKFASKFFKHGGRIGGILELPAGLPKLARDAVEEGFRKSYEGTDNPFRSVVLRDSAKFHQAQQSPRDSQLVEGTEQQVRQVCRWFNLSPSKLGLSDSVSYNSKSEDNQAYLDTTLSHWLKPIAQECTLKLLSQSQRSTMWFEHDPAELLRMNPVQRAEFYNQMISARVMNPNEARRNENMEPYDGGEKFENPNTSSAKGPAQSDTPPAQVPVPAKSRDAENDRRKAAVIFKIADHARQKTKDGKTFVDWIDGDLKTHRKHASELLGSDAIVNEMIVTLKRIADTCNESNLSQMVDSEMAAIEKEAI